MKFNIKKFVFISLLIFTAIFSFFCKVKVEASGLQWYYTDNLQTQVGPFNTQPDCDAALKAAKQASAFSMNFGPCVSKTIVEQPPVPIDPISVSSPNGAYNLLAPLPGLKQVSNTGVCLTDSSASNGIGCYLNLIFKIGIGLCGALAVIMIIIGGVQYMGTESVFGKTEAKGRIFSAILGLFIALGAFAILNTINPDLTGQNGVTVSQVEADIDETPIYSDEGTANTPIPKGKIASCADGVDWVQTITVRFRACKSMWTNLQNLISDAKKSGLTISGGGFRTYDEQVAARKRNGCPDIYNSPASDCRIPTARPGTSMHESGLAFDFKCNGDPIPQHSKTNACYVWLSQNHSKYGLTNLIAGSPHDESWHWSTTGH